MTNIPKVKSRERPCANCGYDLRGAASERCPECGTLTPPKDVRATSRIPWARRREIGRFNAYLRTLWMIVRHPATLAAEIDRPVQRRAARRFAAISLLIAVAIGLASTYLATANSREIHVNPDQRFWDVPFAVFADSPVWAAELAASLAITAFLLQKCLRALLVCGMDPGIPRGRAWRLGHYAAGLLPWMALLLSLTNLSVAAAVQERFAWIRPSERARLWLLLTAAALLPLATGITISTTLRILFDWSKRTWRSATMAILFPLFSLLLFIVITGVFFWSAGYVAIAIKSMLN